MSDWKFPDNIIVGVDYGHGKDWTTEVVMGRNGDGSLTLHSFHSYRKTIEAAITAPASASSSSGSQPVPSEE